jgi:hypothetical protein
MTACACFLTTPTNGDEARQGKVDLSGKQRNTKDKRQQTKQPQQHKGK